MLALARSLTKELEATRTSSSQGAAELSKKLGDTERELSALQAKTERERADAAAALAAVVQAHLKTLHCMTW
eukprot:1161639-Pelagomonas_calceolata.AAC.2